ncbi:prepilin-type N-terminal cleavage/methylation domain-containing protein [Geovibrio thiophilus]|uniref:Prepilin-type N-terminal cleavage/methylation domain-containing protein n=1 Tax=Geovibrio thiophilus TaxID=139438 RepID=A0A410K1Y5_9BACT|nr:prepilin-type N-terminal cleavage/methylation domain-containing protein [Geovibrio thiophilus]QAR34248.1 prepilin-type N-terminal cleavage/methylation domain-containing protein [Geovibrio thiophilus]
MKDNKGFTLAELLIAVALAGIVLTGAYSVFNTIITARDVSVKAGDAVTVNAKLASLLSADFRQAVRNTAEIESLSDRVALKLVTHNSLYFQGAMPVEVLYYIEDKYLIREESLPLMDFEQKMPILPDADNLTVLFYEAGEYHDRTILGTNMIKLRLDTSGIKVEAVAGSYHQNGMFNSLGIGE